MHFVLCFLPVQTVQGRGGAVIKARKLSSAMSAAKAICDHMRDWWFGTKEVCSSNADVCRQINLPATRDTGPPWVSCQMAHMGYLRTSSTPFPFVSSLTEHGRSCKV